MAKHPTLLQHFRSFAYQNRISDIDTALAYFAVFGGTGWDIDTSKSIETCIEEKILNNYESLHHSMTRYTHNNPVYHRVLSIIALGTEHEHDVFKKAKIGKDRGEEAIDYLEKKSLLRFDLSVKEPLQECDTKSDRILFALPFMRFWFGMISQNYKNIAEGHFTEFGEKWQQRKANFPILLSNLLIRELVRQRYMDDPVVSIGTYYDKHTYIDIVAIRKSGKMLAGACKYAKEPAKPHMLHALKEKCKKAELEITESILFSQNGFMPELEQTQDTGVTLLSKKDLSGLLEDLSEADLLTYTNRKY